MLTTSRRAFIAFTAIICLTILGVLQNYDVSASIATIAVAIASSNAIQKSFNRGGKGEPND